MLIKKLPIPFALLFVVAAAACGGSVEVSSSETGGAGAAGTSSAGNAGTGGSSAGSGGTGTSSGGDAGTGGAPAGYCAEACAMTADQACFPKSACAMYCNENAAGWPPAVRDAFAACAAENPLCFQTVESCILGELHESGSPGTVRLKGSGFDAHEGKVITVWNDPDAGTQFGDEAAIVNGAFAFEWVTPLDWFDTSGPLLLLYIDVDGDGTCKPASDITASEQGTWNGDYIDPVYETVLAPPLSDPDFVCNFLP